jgi:hypothetical protein
MGPKIGWFIWENLNLKWMMNRYPHDLGNPHFLKNKSSAANHTIHWIQFDHDDIIRHDFFHTPGIYMGSHALVYFALGF